MAEWRIFCGRVGTSIEKVIFVMANLYDEEIISPGVSVPAILIVKVVVVVVVSFVNKVILVTPNLSNEEYMSPRVVVVVSVVVEVVVIVI